MSIHNKKYILDYIKKYANNGNPPAAPSSEPPAPPPQPDIAGMQTAIKIFADNVVKYDTTRVRDNTGKSKEVVQSTDKRKDFNDFLAEQYSAGSSIKGEEWTTYKDATTYETKQPTDIIELDNVIDGLRRTGSSGKEAMQDGVWDWRTQNAIKNVWAIADALVRVTEDFGTKLADPFTRANLQELGNEIPKTSIAKYDQKKKIEHAKKITPLVDKLTRFYNSYYKGIINSPEYTSYIKKELPLVKVKPGGTDPGKVPPDLADSLKTPGFFKLINVILPTPSGPVMYSAVPVDYIKDIASLEKIMLGLGYPVQDAQSREKQNEVLKAFLAHVNAVAPSV